MRTKGTPVDIKEEDIVSSIHEALQFVSYYHPRDFIQHLSAASLVKKRGCQERDRRSCELDGAIEPP